jgi:hypothetical protein
MFMEVCLTFLEVRGVGLGVVGRRRNGKDRGEGKREKERRREGERGKERRSERGRRGLARDEMSKTNRDMQEQLIVEYFKVFTGNQGA